MTRIARNLGFSSLFLATAAAALTLSGGRGESAAPAPTPQTPITITSASSAVPPELNPAGDPYGDGGGAPTATLDQAAAFAWQEFIALNWPATAQTGAPNTRDTPASDCLLGGAPNPHASHPGTDCATRPLTWQTFRGKAEIFTNGATQNYDDLPTYADVYRPTPNASNVRPVPPCLTPPAQAPVQQGAWINLDETTQIGEDAMYAGAAPSSSPVNSQPRLIRFMAKANRAEFNYYNALGGAAGVGALQPATEIYLRTADPAPGSMQYISLPTNTIEIKAAWRMLTDREMHSHRFHTATVRYYEPLGAGTICYREGTWGLIALHIIQKTASAPYFTYATFEQADNIQTAGGQAVEDANGTAPALPPCRADQTAPCPTTPAMMFKDTPTVNMTNQVPPLVTRAAALPARTQPQAYCQPSGQLYYVNTQELAALPTGGPVCVNYRYNLIPDIIIAANQRAHAAIAAYNTANQIANSPWAYYKLVNVQYVPNNNDPAGPYPGNTPTNSMNPQNFYLSNIVVETNRPLQMFSGSLVGGGATGSNSEYDSQFGGPAGTAVHHNVYYTGVGHNMGGCMGCHGAQGQAQGGDFSVILARGLTKPPEQLPPPVTATNSRTRSPSPPGRGRGASR